MDKHTSHRILFALIGASIFALVPLLLSYTYFRFFDQTNYYTLVQPISIDQKWYRPCDDVVLTSNRTSLMNLSGTIQRKLVLKRANDSNFIVPSGQSVKSISVKKGKAISVSASYRLPCDLANGLYYIEITFIYPVRTFEHTYVAISDTFNVNDLGINPNTVRYATQSAQLQAEPPVRNPAVRVITATPIPQQPATQASQGSQGGGSTTIINNNNTAPTAGSSATQPTAVPAQNPTPQPTAKPTQTPLVCVLGVCL